MRALRNALAGVAIMCAAAMIVVIFRVLTRLIGVGSRSRLGAINVLTTYLAGCLGLVGAIGGEDLLVVGEVVVMGTALIFVLRQTVAVSKRAA